ncbi:centromere protein H (CENP-H)-domain-containing protein [Xylariaceae sp. FL0016]|nr:centromere protein H (CENP-H)-domain-containing protein [Xylariaceae sp. FL0016]
MGNAKGSVRSTTESGERPNVTREHTTSPKSQADLQTELLDARSRYTLRNDVVASVLSANPTLQAVHNGTKASPIERDLLPILQRRDTTSTTLARASQTRATILSDLTETTSSSLSLHRDNAALASELLSLAAQSTAGRDAAMADPAHAPEIARLETEVRSSRQRWRVAKGTASAVVAGSGVDWARDLQLRSIVLDEEDDDM